MGDKVDELPCNESDYLCRFFFFFFVMDIACQTVTELLAVFVCPHGVGSLVSLRDIDSAVADDRVNVPKNEMIWHVTDYLDRAGFARQ